MVRMKLLSLNLTANNTANNLMIGTAGAGVSNSGTMAANGAVATSRQAHNGQQNLMVNLQA